MHAIHVRLFSRGKSVACIKQTNVQIFRRYQSAKWSVGGGGGKWACAAIFSVFVCERVGGGGGVYVGACNRYCKNARTGKTHKIRCEVTVTAPPACTFLSRSYKFVNCSIRSCRKRMHVDGCMIAGMLGHLFLRYLGMHVCSVSSGDSTISRKLQTDSKSSSLGACPHLHLAGQEKGASACGRFKVAEQLHTRDRWRSHAKPL